MNRYKGRRGSRNGRSVCWIYLNWPCISLYRGRSECLICNLQRLCISCNRSRGTNNTWLRYLDRWRSCSYRRNYWRLRYLYLFSFIFIFYVIAIKVFYYRTYLSKSIRSTNSSFLVFKILRILGFVHLLLKNIKYRRYNYVLSILLTKWILRCVFRKIFIKPYSYLLVFIKTNHRGSNWKIFMKFAIYCLKSS